MTVSDRYTSPFFPRAKYEIALLEFFHAVGINYPVSGDHIARYYDIYGEPEQLIDEP